MNSNQALLLLIPVGIIIGFFFLISKIKSLKKEVIHRSTEYKSIHSQNVFLVKRITDLEEGNKVSDFLKSLTASQSASISEIKKNHEAFIAKKKKGKRISAKQKWENEIKFLHQVVLYCENNMPKR